MAFRGLGPALPRLLLQRTRARWPYLTGSWRSHNPKVAGSNPAPAMKKGPVNQGLFSLVWWGAWRRRASIGHQ